MVVMTDVTVTSDFCDPPDALRGDNDSFSWYPGNSWAPFPGASFNTLRPRQDGRHFPDDVFKCIFLNENV